MLDFYNMHEDNFCKSTLNIEAIRHLCSCLFSYSQLLSQVTRTESHSHLSYSQNTTGSTSRQQSAGHHFITL